MLIVSPTVVKVSRVSQVRVQRSPRGSMPSLPSESPQSPTSEHTSRALPAGPSTTGTTEAQPLLQHGRSVIATAGSSESSFSYLRGSCLFSFVLVMATPSSHLVSQPEASLNSELESAFSSNIRAGGSHLGVFLTEHRRYLIDFMKTFSKSALFTLYYFNFTELYSWERC